MLRDAPVSERCHPGTDVVSSPLPIGATLRFIRVFGGLASQASINPQIDTGYVACCGAGDKNDRIGNLVQFSYSRPSSDRDLIEKGSNRLAAVARAFSVLP
jgi:hypothetical protein